jgi:hypothetical protein
VEQAVLQLHHKVLQVVQVAVEILQVVAVAVLLQ